jgi:hypothetical protein
VRFKVLFCGICHSDLHMAKNEWGTSTYPLVPGYVHTQSEKSMTVYSYFSFFLHINIMNGNWQFMEDA